MINHENPFSNFIEKLEEGDKSNLLKRRRIWNNHLGHNAQKWLEQNYPQNQQGEFTVLFLRNKDLTGKLTIEKYKSVESIHCEYNNKLESIELNDLPELVSLNANGCSLKDVNIENCPKISKINLGNNLLESTNFLAGLSHPERLEELRLHGNNFNKDKSKEECGIEFLSKFINLKLLCIDNPDKENFKEDIYNRFCGGLEPLKNLDKLRWLNISSTDIDSGVLFLPISVRKVGCENKKWKDKNGKEKDWGCSKIISELEEKLGAKKVFQQMDAEEPDFAKNWFVIEPHVSKANVMIVPAVSLKFLNKEKLEENYDCHNIKYEEVLLKDGKPFSWEISSNKNGKSQLPPKFYSVRKKEIIETGKEEIEKYAILSYVCGIKESNSRLSLGAKKALKKAEEACYHLGIDYLWIDQLCIDQDNPQEKAEEIRKMHQYYSNAAVTLVSINTNAEEKNVKEDFKTFSLLSVLELVLRSKWFTRSWCYQEGWLSKQTIFMFDDCLIDGRALAGVWVLQQPSYSDGIKYNSISEFNEGTKKIATPLGWTYYKKGYDSSDEVFLSLNEALRAIKDRKRTLPIDGVYSILGLLRYGSEVKVEYKIKNCQCKLSCSHLEEDNTPERALLEVMKTAVKNGYAEPLAWHGKAKNGCLMPNMDKKGSTNVRGSLHIKCEKAENMSFKPYNEKEVVEIDGSVYKIENPEKNVTSFDIKEDFSIDGGAYVKDVTVSYLDENKKKYIERKVTLLGARETLEEMKVNDKLGDI